METKQLTKEAPKQAAKPQTATRAPFCLRLNALRALACISVIMTHVVAFLGLIGKFRSFHYGGHMAVYFFFNLSGYLLSFSFLKEIRRRVNEKKEKNKSPTDSQKSTSEAEKSSEKQSGQIEIPIGEAKKEEEGFNLMGLFKQAKNSVIVSILCKYFWNRTWRLFPLYFGCWCFLKYFALDGIGGSLDPRLKWSDILMLRTFPGHLWTMRIEMMFYYYVIPVYICALYIAFKLQSKGLGKAAKAIFVGLAMALLYGGVLNLRLEQSELHPISHKHRLPDMLPPFYFGMLAALINFALEQKLNARQMAKAQLPKEQEIEVEKTRGVPEKLKEIQGLVLALFDKHKYSLIWTAVFFRIVFLNAGVLATSKPDETWQMSNMESYWYGIFILINDTRGGFWKLMHPNPEPQSAELHPSFMHKIIYYFGLWSYPIYLTHPISYVHLAKYFPKLQYTVEFSVITIFICMLLGGICDFLFDKILVNKIILGKIFASRKVAPAAVAKTSS